MSRTRAVLTATLLVSALTLGGCSDDDPAPKFAPSESPSATESESHSAPAVPAAAAAHTDAGARAFVAHWVDLVNYSQATGETTELERIHEPACAGCRGLVSAISDAYAAGGRIVDGTWSIGRLRELPLDYGADWAGYAKGRTQPQRVIASNGKEQRSTGGRFHLYVYLTWGDEGWRMRWLRTPPE